MTLYTQQKGEEGRGTARRRTTEAVRQVACTCDARRKSTCRLRVRRRLHVLVFKTLRFSSRNLFLRYHLRKRLRIFTSNHGRPIPDREPLGLFSRPATPLRSATSSASSFEDAPHIAKRIRLALQDQRAGSSPSGARSVGESIHVVSEDQVLFDAREKKFQKKFHRST